MCKRHGFTLFELLVTLVIISFALAIAIPPLGQSLQKGAVFADSRELLHLVKLARQSAVFSSVRVVVCAVDATKKCTRDWSQNFLVFTDNNANNRLDSEERIVQYWQHDNPSTRIQWRGFGPGFLRFKDSGTAAENGAFTVCPADGNIHYARQLVINRVGRAYISRDQDGDGIVEYGDDKEPRC
jgi:prepilin-type N-terminal cleavage/methylation domain-containing protein